PPAAAMSGTPDGCAARAGFPACRGRTARTHRHVEEFWGPVRRTPLWGYAPDWCGGTADPRRGCRKHHTWGWSNSALFPREMVYIVGALPKNDWTTDHDCFSIPRPCR